MHVSYHTNFIKNFKKRFGTNLKVRKKYKERLKMFLDNSNNPLLRNHGLVGDKIHLKAFSITGDIRVVYKQVDESYIFLDIGTHNQVYKS